jgi:steroid delta-isomerase-like uncharacterized protein
MTRSAIVELFGRRQQFWEERDADGLAGFHADDGVVQSPIFGMVSGRAAIATSYRNLFKVFADWTLVGDELLIDQDRVAQVFTVQATHTSELFGVPPTGRRFEVHGVLVFELDDAGKFLSERRYYDFTDMLLQLGVLKAKPGAA